MTTIQKLKTTLGSTEHWYIRLLQWPVVILFYAMMLIVIPIGIAFVALTWPFYNWDNRDK
jgi:hypothetical protein